MRCLRGHAPPSPLALRGTLGSRGAGWEEGFSEFGKSTPVLGSALCQILVQVSKVRLAEISPSEVQSIGIAFLNKEIFKNRAIL